MVDPIDLTVPARRRRQCRTNGPSERKAFPQRTDADTDFARPFRDGQRAPVVSQPHVAASISGLLALCSPAAILRRVRPVVVDPVQCVADGWTRPHVGQKRLKGLAPSVAHGDAASSIPEIAGIARIQTTPFCGRPRQVFRRSNHAVSEESHLADVPVQTSTTASRLNEPSQYRRLHDLHAPAVAMAPPHSAGMSDGPKEFGCNQSPEALTGKIWHRPLVLVCAHL